MPPPPSPDLDAPERPAAAGTELIIVLNQGSGSSEAAETEQAITAVLEEADRPFRLLSVEAAEGLRETCQRAARMAAERGAVLVAVGGDGTINTAAQAALAAGCPLGVIAQGTFNLFARDHGLPLDAAAAARVLLQATPQPVQVGWVNQRVFLVNGSLGLYPQVLEDREAFKQQFGRRRWVALLAAVVTLLSWRRQLTLEIELDGVVRRLRTPTVFIGNNRLQLERIGIAGDIAAQVQQGRLVAVVPRPMGRWAKLRLLVRGLVGQLGDSNEVDSFAFRSLTVATLGVRRPKVATDGEVTAMEPPVRFTVAPRPLLLLMPATVGEAAR